MNKFPTLAGITLAAIALAGCSPGINEGIGHRITFDSNGVVVHATGKPDAHIGKDGSLAISSRAIDVTPAQRRLLQRYYQESRDVMDSGEAMGRQGAQMASHSIGAAIRSIFHGDSASADKQLDAQSQKIESAANALCTDVKSLGATQQAIAIAIPAFAPYAADNHMQCTVTNTTIIRDDNTAVSTSSATASKAPSHPENSSASTSSEP